MKKRLNTFLLILVFLLSCSTEDQGGDSTEEQGVEIQENEEVSTVGFKVGGEISSDRSQIKTAESENDDIFAIQFFDIQTQKPYAHVLGDDISLVKVDFIKGHDYRMKMTLIKNAKNIIGNDNGLWATPFRRSDNNQAVFHKPYYSSNIRIRGISAPIISMIENGGTYLEADRYYGLIPEFRIEAEQEDLTIDLKRMVFGITLDIESEDVDQQEIYFSINPEIGVIREYIYTLSEGIGSLEIPYITLGFPNHTDLEFYETEMDRALFSEYQERIHISIGTPDNFTRYFDDYITVTRNKMMTIELSPKETGSISQGSFNITFEEEMMEENIDL